MREYVWVDSWQMQCCGDPFAVGESVTWSVVRRTADWLDALLAQPWPTEVRYVEDHHDVDEGSPHLQVRGVVRSIHALVHELQPVPGQPNAFEAALHTGRLTELRSDDKWRREPHDRSLSFAGWIVELELGAGQLEAS